MSTAIPRVDWRDLQDRKLQLMSETVQHFKDVAGLRIQIDADVYPPGTDTYLLANTVRVKPGGEALDLCTGTGAIAAKLAELGAKSVLGVDLNQKAVDNAEANKALLGLKNVTFKKGNMFEGIDKKFDTIAINPPYTDRPAKNDVDICFFDEGHGYVRSFFNGLRGHLKPDGEAYIAWSNIGPMDLLPQLAEESGFSIELCSQDVGGRGYTFYVYRLKDAIGSQSK